MNNAICNMWSLGAPVFNTTTREVIGVILRGDARYTYFLSASELVDFIQRTYRHLF